MNDITKLIVEQYEADMADIPYRWDWLNILLGIGTCILAVMVVGGMFAIAGIP